MGTGRGPGGDSGGGVGVRVGDCVPTHSSYSVISNPLGFWVGTGVGTGGDSGGWGQWWGGVRGIRGVWVGGQVLLATL